MNKRIEITHIPSVHPGLVLQDELEEIGITQTALAEHVGVLPKTINEICRGKRSISAEMAWKLSHARVRAPISGLTYKITGN